MSMFKKDFWYGGERLKSYSAQPSQLRGMVAGRISLPAQRDLKKQDKSGSDAGAPRDSPRRSAPAEPGASDSILCEHGKLADEPESPSSFLNEIRTGIYHVF